MFEKRLFSLVPEATPYIVASVACKWLALLANVAVMWTLATLLEGALAGAAASLVPLAPWLAAAILVRATAIYLAQRAGDRAAFVAMRRVRSLVYAMLTALGPSYAETVPTSEAVQTSVEGARSFRSTLAATFPSSSTRCWRPSRYSPCSCGRRGFPRPCCSRACPSSPSPS